MNKDLKEEEKTYASEPLFLKSVVKPVEDRVEMRKLSKMCSFWSYGS